VPPASITEFAEQFKIQAADLRNELASDNHNLWHEIGEKLDKGFAVVDEINEKVDQILGGDGGGGGTRAIKNEEAEQFWSENFDQADEVYLNTDKEREETYYV